MCARCLAHSGCLIIGSLHLQPLSGLICLYGICRPRRPDSIQYLPSLEVHLLASPRPQTLFIAKWSIIPFGLPTAVWGFLSFWICTSVPGQACPSSQGTPLGRETRLGRIPLPFCFCLMANTLYLLELNLAHTSRPLPHPSFP